MLSETCRTKTFLLQVWPIAHFHISHEWSRSIMSSLQLSLRTALQATTRMKVCQHLVAINPPVFRLILCVCQTVSTEAPAEVAFHDASEQAKQLEQHQLHIQQQEQIRHQHHNNSRPQSNQRKAPFQNGPHSKRRPSLLERLHATEVRKERNTVLQCIRYIVQNQFFEDVLETSVSAADS
eukprot:m.480976 g.480976  ORF g.480976 m.480976 type:complete len:180 (+) comp57180_c0_seq16:1137-1676(+)